MKTKRPTRRRGCLPATIALSFLTWLALAEVSMPGSCQTVDSSSYTFTTLACRAADPQSGEQAASHFTPKNVAVDTTGTVYFTDPGRQVICRMEPTGKTTIIAGKLSVSGSSDGTGNQARFRHPRGIAIDAANDIIVADSGNNTIRRITPRGVVTTIAGLAGIAGSADGRGSNALFHYPVSVAVDRLGNIYVADTVNGTIRKVTPQGVVTTVAGQAGVLGAGDGRGTAAMFNYPMSVAVDGSDNIYVADFMNNAIRKVTAVGKVTTLAGRLFDIGGNTDGTGSAARFFHPTGIGLDRAGNIYVADCGNQTIRRIAPNGDVTTVAGSPGQSGIVDGIGSSARFWHPVALALDRFGNLYVADLANGAIRIGTLSTSTNTNTALSPRRSDALKTSFP